MRTPPPPPAAVRVTGHAAARTIFTDPAFAVPEAPDAVAGIPWLRARVCRFSNGETHRRRRALVTDLLSRVDAEAAGDRARARTAAVPRDTAGQPTDLTARVARTVPVATLAEALGAGEIRVGSVIAAARGYPLGASADPDADRAVAELVEECGGAVDEATAALIGLLAQACDATAGLVSNAAMAMTGDGPAGSVAEIVTETLRLHSPVRTTRRVALAAARVGGADVEPGAVVDIDVAAANRDPAVFRDADRFDARLGDRDRHLSFGFGPRACPGRDHARAIAAGILEALHGYRAGDDPVVDGPSANSPARPGVTPR